TTPPRQPRAAIAVRSLTLPRERALAEAGVVHGALHRVLALDGAGIGAVDFGALRVGAEGVGDGLALHRAGELGLAERTRIVAGELLAVLLEGEGRRARPGAGFDVEDPFAGHVDLVRLLRPRGRRREDHRQRDHRRPTTNACHGSLFFLLRVGPHPHALKTDASSVDSRRRVL